MSYENLEEARVKRAAKDAAKAKGKGTRGWKAETTRKRSPVLEPNTEMARMTEVQVAPVARMV